VLREGRKEVRRLERDLQRLADREARLHDEMAASATDHGRLRELDAELRAVTAEREQLEEAWLHASEALEA
jgi:ATP-binding cassette subfamily F protein uup